jgi:hypothetical protein
MIPYDFCADFPYSSASSHVGPQSSRRFHRPQFVGLQHLSGFLAAGSSTADG